MGDDPIEQSKRRSPHKGKLVAGTNTTPSPIAARSLQRARRLATVMDSAFRVPLTNRRIGFDSLIGLIPGIGDIATTAVSAMIVREAMRIGVSKRTLGLMVANIGVDMLIGSVPLLGDIFDFAFKSNMRNVDLLEREVQKSE